MDTLSDKDLCSLPTLVTLGKIKVLHAKIETYLAVARKNGIRWYVGVMTNQEARKLEIDYSFLEEGTYSIELFKDGINADRYAGDYKKEIKGVTNRDVMKAKLTAGEGWSAILFKN